MVGATAVSLEGLVAVDADVVRLRRGDPNALSELITRYQNRLYRYLLRLVRQPAEAEDLFQQTWLRVVEKIRSFDASRNFDAWLFTLARNLAIVRTPPGHANGVARAIDLLGFGGLVGSVAGDDTVLIVTDDDASARRFKRHLDQLAGAPRGNGK